MTETNATNPGQRDRSPAYPIIPLGPALERLAQFEAHFKRSAARPEKVGDAWGIKAKAYADRTAAALRYFGLLEYQGAGGTRSVVVSELGRNYLRAQQEEMKRQIIAEVALKPKQIAIFWNAWGADRPADAACLDELVLKNDFSEAGARDFLKVYDDTISFAKPRDDAKVMSHQVIDDQGEEPPPGKPEVGDLVQVEIDGALQFEKPVRVRAIQDHDGQKWVFVDGSKTGVLMEQVTVQQKGAGAPKGGMTPPILDIPDAPPAKGTRREVFALDEGDVVLTFPADLSATSFEDLDAYLKVFISKMRRRAGVANK
jgi:hypothetical protein